MAFQSFDDVFRFFDVMSNGKISKEHFWICIGTFNIDLSFTDILNLFEYLDVSRDGVLEITEMMNGLFPRGFGMTQGNPNYQSLNDHNNPQLFSDELASVMSQRTQITHNKYSVQPNFSKRAPEKDEMMDYPYFFRMKLQNLNLNQGKMIGAAPSLKPKRALSIVNSTTKEFLNDQRTTTSKPQINASASTTVVSPRNFGGDSMSARPITVDPMMQSNKRSHSKNGNKSSSLSNRGHDHNAPHCVLKAAEKDGMMIDLI